MKIDLKRIKIREVFENYVDNKEEGVLGYNRKLNIRPKYQREFVYDEKKRNAVIHSIMSGFPLNVMYWVKNTDGGFEMLDGQQRTISFCQYLNNDYSFNSNYAHSLKPTELNKILDYELLIYFCEGTDKEVIDWFEVINTAGEKLTPQELRNAVYTGTWLTHAKSIFSKTNCAAYLHSKDYVNGTAIRQELLQTAIEWHCGGSDDKQIREYMSKHQHDPNANELWAYYKSVIDWVNATYGCPKNYRKEMKGINWNVLYTRFSKNKYNPAEVEKAIYNLMADPYIENKKGIYTYVLDGDTKNLNVRVFDGATKRAKYEQQKGICPECEKQGKNIKYTLDQMDADHITAWSKGGKTAPENCTMLCKYHNRLKGNG